MGESDHISTESRAAIWADLGLSDLYARAMKRKWLVAIIPIVWVLLSNIIFHYSASAYSAELLIVPASVNSDSSAGSGLSGALSSFGLDLGAAGGGADQNFSIYLETWTSSWFAEQLLANKPLAHQIFAGLWSERDQKWIDPSGMGSAVKSKVKEIFGGKPAVWSAPGTEDMLGFLQGAIKVTKVRGQVTTRVSVENRDPELAKKILQFGHTSINAHLAQLFKRRADQNVSYILSQLGSVSVAEYRQALLNTLSQVERTRMLAFANREFAATSLSLYVTANPVKPQGGKIIMGSLLGAVLLYLALVIVADRLRLPVTMSDFLPSFRRR